MSFNIQFYYLRGFVYKIAQGRDKQRLTREGKARPVDTYRTTIISTGEKNIVQENTQFTGEANRVLTFNQIQWTTSGEHAKAVEAFVHNNYGLPLVYLVKHLLKLGLDESLAIYKKNRELYLEKSLVKNTFTDRLSSKYAFVLTATELANECMGLDLPFDYILDMLLQNEASTMDSRDLAQKAYDYLIEQANVNMDKFSSEWKGLSHDDMKDLPKVKNPWGKRSHQRVNQFTLDGRQCTTIIYFAKGKFDEILMLNNFEEPSIIIKMFKQRQWLDHDSDRNTRTVQIAMGGERIDVYALRVFGVDEPDELDDAPRKTFAVTNPKKRIPTKKLKSKATKKPLVEDEVDVLALLDEDEADPVK